MGDPGQNPFFLDPRIDRREMLRRASNGFGALALSALLGRPSDLIAAPEPAPRRPIAPKAPHAKPKPKSA